MRNIKQLLELLLENINNGKFKTGLCFSVFLLNNEITKEEYSF